MALLENRIEAYNREATVHELTPATLGTLEKAASDQAEAEAGAIAPDLTDATPPEDFTANDARDEIEVVRAGVKLLGTPPSEELLCHVRDLLDADS